MLIVLIHPDQEDYQAVSLELTLSERVNQSCVRIPIQNDDRVEDPEEFTVTLNSTDPDVMPGPPSTVTIVDDDGEDMTVKLRKDEQYVLQLKVLDSSCIHFSLQESPLALRMKRTHLMRDNAQ